MARKALQKNKKHKKLKPHKNTFEWFTRGVEMGLIFSSLFWAVEAVAGPVKPSQDARHPARLTETHSKKSIGPDFALESSFPKKIMKDPSKKVRRPDVPTSSALTAAFKYDPRYAPPVAEVGRFPTPK